MNRITKRALALVIGLSLALAAVAATTDGFVRPGGGHNSSAGVSRPPLSTNGVGLLPFSTGSLASGSTWSG